MSKQKRNLSKIAGLHTGTDKNGKTFYFGEVNEGSTLLILPNMNAESDGAGRFDYIAFFAPNNRYEETEPEADAPASGAAEAKTAPPVIVTALENGKPKDFATLRKERAAAKATQPEEIVSAPVTVTPLKK